jgi:hypothetical protein
MGAASPMVFATAQSINDQQYQNVLEVEHDTSTSGN